MSRTKKSASPSSQPDPESCPTPADSMAPIAPAMPLPDGLTFNSKTIDEARQRILRLRQRLAGYFVGKDRIIDVMLIGTLAQEPVLLVGKPGTGKSDLVVKFCQALGLTDTDYFEYMLTKFTEPSELIGPIDILQLKSGKYVRRIEGKLPEARIVFLDEIFKSNSAILNTLLSIINERKYYQDGKPVPVKLLMLFGATNEIPEQADLAALRDRFTLKIESEAVHQTHFDELLEKGLQNEAYRAFNQRPWQSLASLDDFLLLKNYLDYLMYYHKDDNPGQRDREQYFPQDVYTLFKRILKTLEKEDRVLITDRKIIKIYRLIRTRAFLFHGGVVNRDDLQMMQYLPDRLSDFAPVREKVSQLLRLD